ncbi:MAG TPA: hypothetical protein VFQ53_29195 [Kofleriaceae bacterium]|nr:hypothetical protein [Kofleriaceae bacterium]
MRMVATLALLAACSDGTHEEFGFVGEVADQTRNGSVIGLFVVSTADPVYLYKLGDGSTVGSQFDISFDTVPPPEAINADGVGIAELGMLPGLSTIPDGVVAQSDLRLIGLSINTAVIYKAPGAAGPAWSTSFPEGFACARCVDDPTGGLDTFEPIDCSFVVVEAVTSGGCGWY